MHEFLSYLEGNYYTEVLSLCAAFTGLFLSAKNIQKAKWVKFLFYYFIGYIIAIIGNLFAYYAYYAKINLFSNKESFSYNVDFCFTVFEYFVFANILKNFVNKNILFITSL